MKYLKKFENKKIPEVGDYVQCDVYVSNKNITTLLKNSIGKFVGKISNDEHKILYSKDVIHKIKSFLSPDEEKKLLVDEFFIIFGEEIKYWSKDKKELEIQLSTKKYNL